MATADSRTIAEPTTVALTTEVLARMVAVLEPDEPGPEPEPKHEPTSILQIATAVVGRTTEAVAATAEIAASSHAPGTCSERRQSHSCWLNRRGFRLRHRDTCSASGVTWHHRTIPFIIVACVSCPSGSLLPQGPSWTPFSELCTRVPIHRH